MEKKLLGWLRGGGGEVCIHIRYKVFFSLGPQSSFVTLVGPQIGFLAHTLANSPFIGRAVPFFGICMQSVRCLNVFLGFWGR